MEHSKYYFKAFNEILQALEEVRMWSVTMTNAIETAKSLSEDERANFIETVSQEFVKVNEKFRATEKKFKELLNGAAEDKTS